MRYCKVSPEFTAFGINLLFSLKGYEKKNIIFPSNDVKGSPMWGCSITTFFRAECLVFFDKDNLRRLDVPCGSFTWMWRFFNIWISYFFLEYFKICIPISIVSRYKLLTNVFPRWESQPIPPTYSEHFHVGYTSLGVRHNDGMYGLLVVCPC